MRTTISFPVLKDDYDILMKYLLNAPLELQYNRTHADQLERHLGQATVLERSEFPRGVVCLGARVVLRDTRARLNYQFKLGLPGTADGQHDHLSVLSPLGRQLLGARLGEMVTVAAAKGQRHYLVREVSFPFG